MSACLLPCLKLYTFNQEAQAFFATLQISCQPPSQLVRCYTTRAWAYLPASVVLSENIPGPAVFIFEARPAEASGNRWRGRQLLPPRLHKLRCTQ